MQFVGFVWLVIDFGRWCLLIGELVVIIVLDFYNNMVFGL